MKRLVIALIFVPIFIVVAQTARVKAPPSDSTPSDVLAIDGPTAARNLSAVLAIPSVSGASDAPAIAPFARLHEVLANRFPLAHSHLRLEKFHGGSLLYTWNGTDPSLDPLLLLAHLDVVPALGEWTHPAFSGHIDEEGWIWGRGAIDDKTSVTSILAATEALIESDFRPRRTVIIALGHDEETGGHKGALRMSKHLATREIHPMLVLDEGGLVTTGIMPGLDRPVATVGVSEKGYLTVELVVRSEGGHASMPAKESAVGILARAITQLENNPMPSSLGPVPRAMFTALCPHMGIVNRAVFANLWLTAPMVKSFMGRTASTRAMLHTTTAPTMLQGSPQDNVLAVVAKGWVNFRILQGDTVDSVLRHVRETIDDERVEVIALPTSAEPSAVSPTSGKIYDLVRRSIQQAVPDVVVAPYPVVGATDARHYASLTPHVYRFLPLHLRSADDLARIHGIDERVHTDDVVRSIQFYGQLIRNSSD